MSLFILSFLSFFLCFSSSLAGPHARQARQHSSCRNPSTRVDWNTFSQAQKDAYFEAELCLMNRPAQLNLPDVQSRYDDIVAVHQLQANTNDGTDTWHFVGQFLHVHRFYIHVHETLLREECGYTGPMAYWNEEADAGNYENSRVIQDFGGFGPSSNNRFAVSQGPFAQQIFPLGPGSDNSPHPLARSVNERQARTSGSFYVDGVKSQTAFADFKDLLYDTLHVAGHNGIGGGWGDMSNVLSSPNDPIFFLHHTYLDMIWTGWQGNDQDRIHDLNDAGNESLSAPPGGFVPTNPGTTLFVYDLLPSVTVADVASATGGYLCYRYE